MSPRRTELSLADGKVDHRELQAVPGKLISSFAQDPAGELYVLSLAGGIYRLDPG